MAADLKNASEDADITECEGEKVVTMMDVLKEQEDFEEDANAVLGGSDDKNCTYSKGYIKRQALYACLTCCSEARLDPEKRAGVCLACSLMCHENHELIELYTKRNFRCDCGNPKFNSHPCTFTPNKTEVNEDNKYNQNFSGVYCICKRPYPDPEATFEDEMIQCIICEDWLHSSHLDATVPANDQYSEMICKQCMDKNEFLHDYSDLAVNSENTIENVQTKSSDKDISIISKEKDTSNLDVDVEMSEITGTDKNILTDNSNRKCEDDENNKKNDINTENKLSLPEPNSTSDDSDKVPNAIDNNENKEEIISDQKTESTDNVEKEKDTKLEHEDIVNQSESTLDNNKETNVLQTSEENLSQDNKVSEENVSDENSPSKKEIEKNTLEEKQQENAQKIEEDRLLGDPDDETKCDAKDAKNSTTESTKVEEAKADPTKPENELKSENNAGIPTENVNMDAKQEDNTKSEVTEVNDEQSPSKEKHLEKRKLVTAEVADVLEVKKLKLDAENKNCLRPRGVKRFLKGATFWPSNFRQKLCSCQECLTMYKDLSILFLTDPEDTVTAYENLGKEIVNGKPLTQYEKGLEALSSLNRIQQINALTEYNNMRDKLLDFLKSFKDRKEIVKEEDIKAFFAGMKPKREPDGVYFCR